MATDGCSPVWVVRSTEQAVVAAVEDTAASRISVPAPAVNPVMLKANTAVTSSSRHGELMDWAASISVGGGLTSTGVAAVVVLAVGQGAAATTVAARLTVCMPGLKGVAAAHVTGTSTLAGWGPLRPAYGRSSSTCLEGAISHPTDAHACAGAGHAFGHAACLPGTGLQLVPFTVAVN